MVEEILYRIRLGKHYWRSAPFVEMAELYMSRFLRTVSQSMIGLFVAVFLYQKGYSIVNILLLVGGYYSLRVIFSLLSAYYVAWEGPKRAMLVSNILIVPSLFSLTIIDTYTVASVVSYFFFQALSFSLYYVAADTQFSSIKHEQNVGKEIGWLQIVEKIGTGVAPMIGGFVAYAFGPETVMWIAAGLSVASAFPLFLSPEKIRRRQKIIFRGFPFRILRQQLTSYRFVGVDYVTSSAIWSLFVAVVIFGTADNSVYAKLGVVFSISLAASIISSHLYGVLIDRRHSRELFKTGVFINAALHATRPFIGNPVAVGVMNVANEAGTNGYQMPYVQNEYDTADNLPGYRVVYLASMYANLCFGAATMSFLSALLVWQLGDVTGMQCSFFVAAVATLFLLRSGFPALRR